jgi:hypothetical protein
MWVCRESVPARGEACVKALSGNKQRSVRVESSKLKKRIDTVGEINHTGPADHSKYFTRLKKTCVWLCSGKGQDLIDILKGSLWLLYREQTL